VCSYDQRYEIASLIESTGVLMVDITSLGAELKLLEDGIWHSSSRQVVSYPVEGNKTCFALEDSSFWFRHRNACITTVVKRFPAKQFLFCKSVGLIGGSHLVSLGK